MIEEEEMFRLLLNTAKRIRRTSELDPVMVIDAKDGRAVWADLQEWWGDHDVRRELMFQLGSTLGFGLEAVSFYMVTDIWMGTNVALQPSKDPKRSEAIMIGHYPKEGDMRMQMSRYKKTGKRIQFQPPQDLSTGAIDYTFKLFWEGYNDAEKRVGDMAKLFGAEQLDDKMDTGFTAREHAKSAAMRVAMEGFGFKLVSFDEMATIERNQRRGRNN